MQPITDISVASRVTPNLLVITKEILNSINSTTTNMNTVAVEMIEQMFCVFLLYSFFFCLFCFIIFLHYFQYLISAFYCLPYFFGWSLVSCFFLCLELVLCWFRNSVVLNKYHKPF